MEDVDVEKTLAFLKLIEQGEDYSFLPKERLFAHHMWIFFLTSSNLSSIDRKACL